MEDQERAAAEIALDSEAGARELIAHQSASLDDNALEAFVGGFLRAMGYYTRVPIAVRGDHLLGRTLFSGWVRSTVWDGCRLRTCLRGRSYRTDRSAAQAPASEKLQTATAQTRERTTTSKSASSQGAGRVHPMIRLTTAAAAIATQRGR